MFPANCGTGRRLALATVGALTFAAVQIVCSETSAQSLEDQLRREGTEAIAAAALREGDPQRGAIVFFQPHMTCAKCHTTADNPTPLGPDLSRPTTEITATHLVQSLLEPSAVIREGYKPVSVLTQSGQSYTGLVAEDGPDELVLRDAAGDGRLVTIRRNEIEERLDDVPSIMPTGLLNQLADRRQALDLIRYLAEISSGGPSRAAELRPINALLQPVVPDYESDIDHSGLIAAWDDESYERGEAIYNRTCVNCHGTHDRPGSLPTSLPFARGKFKNGSDPYSMYRTLTYGYGMMAAQTWLVPRQKYDAIHYLREAYLKASNQTQYSSVTSRYLSSLPRGTQFGPEPVDVEPWVAMDYGPSLMASYEIGEGSGNFAYKGIAVRLDAGTGGVSRGQHWVVYDHDTLRMAGAYSGTEFIDYEGIMFNGRHEVHPHTTGTIHVANPVGPGWAGPAGDVFDDPRMRGRDGKPYGPLPRDWAQYLGLHHVGQQTVLAYRVGSTEVLESPGLAAESPSPVFTRTFRIQSRPHPLIVQVARIAGDGGSLEVISRSSNGSDRAVVVRSPGAASESGPSLLAGLQRAPPGARFRVDNDRNLRLVIPGGEESIEFTMWMSNVEQAQSAIDVLAAVPDTPVAHDPAQLTMGGPPRWPGTISTTATMGDESSPLTVDVLAPPDQNPWSCRVRPTGFDFYPGGAAMAVCTWDGDVWRVEGIDAPDEGLSWQRIASGLFQPLGLRIVDGQLYVACRDQIVVLADRNADGETDWYRCFNNDHQVTEHFHEFAMGLQTDDAGNFYYAKSARHAKRALVPHHGTLLRVSADGTQTEILATGFRAANGVCINGDGTFLVTDQEGHWNPKNRINWVSPGGFYGNMWGYHDVTDSSDSLMRQPLCWITNDFDRSPSELLWIDQPGWGPLSGALLNFSYGYGKVYIVLHEEVSGIKQGGMVALDIPRFPTGVMRGRLHPETGHLYVCGMFAWAGNQTQPGGLYRIRYTGKPLCVPVRLSARRAGMEITFSEPLDAQSAVDAANYQVKTWSLKRTAEYGSDHYNERPSLVDGVQLSPDGRTVLIELADNRPTWCMEIVYSIKAENGDSVDGRIHNTIHAVAE